MMRKLSDFKIKNRTMVILNSFRPNFFRTRYGLSTCSYHIDLYDASDRLDRNIFTLSDMNSGPIKLSRLSTRHLKLRDFGDNDELVCERWHYDVTDQTSRLLFMLYGGKL